MIISKTPFRVSFFGGGTDYPAWFREHGGKVLATAIDKYCYISCRYLPPFFDHKYRIVYSKNELTRSYHEIEHPAVRAVFGYLKCEEGLEVHHFGDLPARTGLGSSSAFTVGLLNAVYAMKGVYRSSGQLAKESIYVEQEIIKEPVGAQDQITTAFGGFNRVEFYCDGTFDVSPCVMPAERLASLKSHMMLFFTGVSRYSSEIAKSKVDNIKNRVMELRLMGEMVDEAVSILRSENTPIEEFGRLLDQSWQYKRKLSDKVSNAMIDEVYAAGQAEGAIGGKLLGAGGGGFILLFVPRDQQEKVRQRLSKLTEVPFQFEQTGSRIVLYQPNGLGGC